MTSRDEVHQHDDAEHMHYKEIINSFLDYPNWIAGEARRRDAHLSAMPEKWKALLPATTFEPKSDALREAIAANAAFLKFIAVEQEKSGFGLQFRGADAHDGNCGHSHDSAGHSHGHHNGTRDSDRLHEASIPAGDGVDGIARPTSSPSHYSKVKSTLHQLVRDWSREGQPEREASYGPIITELQRVLPVTASNRNKQRVLVPGCGLGRLLYDLVASGYAAQGNEFSLQMLFTAHVVLNLLTSPECVKVHAFIHDPRCVPSELTV